MSLLHRIKQTKTHKILYKALLFFIYTLKVHIYVKFIQKLRVFPNSQICLTTTHCMYVTGIFKLWDPGYWLTLLRGHRVQLMIRGSDDSGV